MNLTDYTAADATDLASLIARGEVTASEVKDAAAAAYAAVNPTLNAVIREHFDEPRISPNAAGGPLDGVPVVVKDLDGTIAGWSNHQGTELGRRHDVKATQTALALQRLLDAGAAIVGVTNTPEFGLVPSTEPASCGPTKNPWDLTRSPAGSSGGSAAAVAAGIVPIGHAGDGGGSIRLPAGSCGLVGLIPSLGRVPTWPDVAPWGGLARRLAVTRTVRDTALVLDVMGAPLPHGPILPTPAGGFRAALDSAAPRLRISCFTGPIPDGTPVDPRVAAAAEQVAALLGELCHETGHAVPDALLSAELAEQTTGAFISAYSAWTTQSVDAMANAAGVVPSADGFEPHTWALAEAGRAVSATSMWGAYETLLTTGAAIRQGWRSPVGDLAADDPGIDILVLPTCPELPWTLGQFRATGPDDALNPVFRSASIVATAVWFNISGQPAISLPLAEVDGLPVGVQLVAAIGREDLLLAVAAQLEQAQPWAARRPAVHAAR